MNTEDETEGIPKGRLGPEKRKCMACTTYLRKIEEIQQSLSGREAIIKLLQGQIKKCENNYKQLLDSFEKLRFEHSTALQENFSLKEINAKLGVDGNKIRENDQNPHSNRSYCSDKRPPSDNRSSSPKLRCYRCSEVQNKTITTISRNVGENTDLLPEVESLRRMVKDQSSSLKLLLKKVLMQLDKCKCIGDNLKEDIRKISETSDFTENDMREGKIKELSKELADLKNLVEVYKNENYNMKQQIMEKSSDLNVPENQFVIDQGTQFRQNPENLMEKKSTITQCGNQQIFIYCTDELTKKIEELTGELADKEATFADCKCKLTEQVNDLMDRNNLLSETLEVITEENKSNVETIGQLSSQMKAVTKEFDKCTCEMQCRILELENATEDLAANEENLRALVQRDDEEIAQLQKHISDLNEENKKLMTGETSPENVHNLKQTIENLKNDIRKKIEELNECREENKHNCDAIDILMMQSADIQSRYRALQDSLLEKEKEFEMMRKLQDAGQTEVNAVKKENADINSECECLKGELVNLQGTVRCQLDQIDRLQKENKDLQLQILMIKRESQNEVDKLKQSVIQSKKQVDSLLKEHDEKNEQFINVANELDNIRKSVTEDNNNFTNKVTDMECENNELRKKCQDYEDILRDCEKTCEKELEKLKDENTKKQKAIEEFKKTIDNFNSNMTQFDKNVEELAADNEKLKEINAQLSRDNESLRKQLDNGKSLHIQEISRASQEIEDLQNALDGSRNQNIRNSQQLQLENENLKRDLEELRKNTENAQDQYKRKSINLEIENNDLKLDLDETFRRGSAFSKQLENLKDIHHKLKKDYANTLAEMENLKQEGAKQQSELRQQSAQLEIENEELRKEFTETTRRQTIFTQQANELKDIYNKLKEDLVAKCAENDGLKAKLDEITNEKQQSKDQYKNLIKSRVELEKELYDTMQKYNDLKKCYDENMIELKKLKKECDACSRQSQISREEYNHLKKEYKEIKTMLSNQIKKYKNDTSDLQAKSKPCKVVAELKKQLIEKEQLIASLQEKLKNASCEVIELKDYVHKILSDNNILKTAINNLIENLERKIRGPSKGTETSSSAEVMAGEILQSLTVIESNIIRKCNSCPIKECNCMSEILSQYDGKERQLYVKDLQEEKLRVMSESSTPNTDSDDCQCINFLDKNSAEYFKEKIRNLECTTDMDLDTKNSCNCERPTRCSNKK